MSRKTSYGDTGLTMPGLKTPTVAASDAGYTEEFNVGELFNRLHGLTLRETAALPNVCTSADCISWHVPFPLVTDEKYSRSLSLETKPVGKHLYSRL